METWPTELDLPNAAALLDQTLKGEKATDLALTALANRL
jgi:ferritin-like metal-binding protein YciE